MGSRDPRIDAYIAKAAPFAQPILQRLREVVHETCPAVEETLKWSMPTFVYAGGILAGMGAFKQHVSFGYWKHALVMGEDAQRDGMGSYGKMASAKDVPPKKRLVADIRRAMALNELGVKAAGPRKAAPKPAPEPPADLLAALVRNRRAKTTFDAFAPSHRREYIEWIVEAKREDTRRKRLDQAIEWMSEGKCRHWKYERS